MATVTLRGRFPKGSIVTLVEVAGAHVLRAEGGEEIETRTVGEENGASVVQFSKGVREGARYFVTGLIDGRPEEVRATGREEGDAAVLEQAPIGPDRVRLSDGSWADEAPPKRDVPKQEVGPDLGQDQVPEGTPQRSDTWRGTAHPHDPKEPVPYRDQRDVAEGTQQMSDTRPREVDGQVVGGGGQATEIVQSLQRQEDVHGVAQRSDTLTGQAAPLPAGDALEAQQSKESSRAKESRGERGAAEPIAQPAVSKRKVSRAQKREEPTGDQPSDTESSGEDAMGQELTDQGLTADTGSVPEDASEAGASKTELNASTGAGSERPKRQGRSERAPQAGQ
jgi:hypothetical protein